MAEMSGLDLMLEAERRGILPPEKKPLLDEARRRGLVPGGVTPSAPAPAEDTRPFYERPVPEAYRRGAETLKGFAKGLGEANLGVLKGARDAAVNIADLPGDVASQVSPSLAPPDRKRVSDVVPDIEVEGAPGKLVATLTQYGLPAVGSASVVKAAMQGYRPAVQYLSMLLAGGASDAAVASPEDGTVGDILGGPTATSPDDTPLERRLKIGAEGAAIPAILDAPHRLGSAAKRGLKTMFGSEAEIADLVARNMQNAAIDKDKAIKGLNDVLEQMRRDELSPGVRPTSGTASNDPGLIAIERGVATKGDTNPVFYDRKTSNLAAVSDDLNKATRDVAAAGDPEAARRVYQQQVDDALQAARQPQEAAQSALDATRAETENAIEQFRAAQGGRQADASQVIDDTVRDELVRITAEKNRLFRAIDPDYAVEIPRERIAAALDEITTPRSALDRSATALPNDVVAPLREALEADAPLTYGALEDFRPTLSQAIATARAANDGGVVERLVALRNALDNEAALLAQGGSDAAGRAAAALDYYRGTYVPRFKQGVGDAFRRAERRGAPFPATTTGNRFLRAGMSSGPSESAAQLRTIIEGAPDPTAARQAVRDHVLGDVADLMTTTDGKVARDRLNAYLSRREVREALDQFPEVRDEVLAFRNNLGDRAARETRFGSDLKAATEALQRTEKDIAKSATRFFIDKDPMAAVSAVFSSDNPGRRMSELARQARLDRSGDAMRGLKASVAEYLENQVRGTTEIAGDLSILQSRVSRLLDNPKTLRALQVVYSPAELNTLRRVQRSMRLFDRINAQVTAGSPTASLSQASKQAQTFLFSLYGIVKGRGVFQIGRLVQKLTGRDPEEIAKRLFTDAMLDPELARTLLMKDTLANRPALERSLVKWTANNLVGGDAPEASDQQPE